MLAVLVSSFLAGLVGVLSVQNRADGLDEIGTKHAAVNTAALEVYRALAAADATSLNVMLVSGDEEARQQQAFRDDIAAVTAALESATRTAPTGVSAEKLSRLTDAVPVYVGLVESGWVYGKQVQPLGISYLTEATGLVRGTLLPAADAVREAETAAIAEAQDKVDDFPWAATLTGLLAVAVLWYCQRFLAKRTRRRFNIGMVAATAATIAAFAWLAIAAAVAASHSADALARTEQLIAPLSDARAQGRATDGDEARNLIFPKLGDHERLIKTLGQIGDVVRKAQANTAEQDQAAKLSVAQDAVTGWRDAHASSTGKSFSDAAKAITNPPEGQNQTYAAALDESLGAVITNATSATRASVGHARSALAGVDWLVIVLMLLGAAAAVAGLWPRIVEYR